MDARRAATKTLMTTTRKSSIRQRLPRRLWYSAGQKLKYQLRLLDLNDADLSDLEIRKIRSRNTSALGVVSSFVLCFFSQGTAVIGMLISELLRLKTPSVVDDALSTVMY